jgi:DNA-binding FadR family transcriptional regulator
VEKTEEALISRIRETGLRAGDRLPTEAELTRWMRCSRNVLREAVGRLVSVGLVEVRRGTGMFVGSADAITSCARLLGTSLTISGADLVEFTEFRRVLEGAAARRAAAVATAGEIHELCSLAEAIDEAGIPREESLRRDQAFHLRLMEIGGNRLMAAVLGSLIDYLHASMDITTSTPRDTETSCRLHAAIVDALKRRDGDAAEHAMELNRRHTIARLATHPGRTAHGTHQA